MLQKGKCLPMKNILDFIFSENQRPSLINQSENCSEDELKGISTSTHYGSPNVLSSKHM